MFDILDIFPYNSASQGCGTTCDAPAAQSVIPNVCMPFCFCKSLSQRMACDSSDILPTHGSDDKRYSHVHYRLESGSTTDMHSGSCNCRRRTTSRDSVESAKQKRASQNLCGTTKRSSAPCAWTAAHGETRSVSVTTLSPHIVLLFHALETVTRLQKHPRAVL